MTTLKLLPRNILLIIIALWASGCTKPAEQNATKPSLEEIANEIIAASGTCTLITLDSTGQPRARIMDPFPPEDKFIIWFGTNTRSRKVTEIKMNSRATLNYYEKATASYVSLYGKAEIVTAPELTSKYWKTTWQDFYPDYPEGYCLIRFTPGYLELISGTHGIAGDPITWKPATIKF